ncbi:hypothetical protein JCM10213v2_001964 [Rhodosporidiobolus nylandii]
MNGTTDRPSLAVNTTCPPRTTSLPAHDHHDQQQQGQAQYQQHYYSQQPTEQPFSPPSSLLTSSSAFESTLSPSSSVLLPSETMASTQQTRSVSKGRSQSMRDPSSSSTSAGSGVPSGAAAGGVGAGSDLGARPSSGDGQAGGSSSGAAGEAEAAVGAGLARRNNTVSTASSRLVRLERTRARLALQGAGLSEEDQNFYVPPSPARGPGGTPYGAINAPWSDIGHGSSAAASSSASLPLAGGVSVAGTSSPIAAAFGVGTQQQGGAGEDAWRQQQQQPQQPSQPAQPEQKRSSFVVLRGGKGDAALTERRSHSSAISPPPSTSYAPPPSAGAAAELPLPLRHKNSLKPFLEQERAQAEAVGGAGAQVEEDWERGLVEERKSGAGGGEGALDGWQGEEDLSSPFSSTTTVPHTRSNTFHTHTARRGNTTDPWLPPSASPSLPQPLEMDDPSLIRRHQSLTSFRQREPSIEQTMGVLSSSPASSSWADHAGAIDEQPLPTHGHLQQQNQSGRPLGSLALAGAQNIAGFGSRARSGTSPAPLTLHHSASLGHAPSGARTGGGGTLSHSNSLSSHPAGANLTHSNSLSSRSDSGVDGASAAGRRMISPVMNAFPGTRSPWSPTEEETKQLSLASVERSSSGSLSRGGSGSSRGSHAGHGGAQAQAEYASLAGGVNGRFAEEVMRLEDQMSGMQLGGLSASPSACERVPSTSPQPPAVQQGGAGAAARRLPPLMTSPDALLTAAGGARGAPQSAAAYVPPIGHSHYLPASFGGMGAGGLDGISEHPVAPSSVAGSFAPPMPPASNGFLPPGGAPLPPLHPGAFDAVSLATMGGGASRGHATALPGAPSAADWARQKELLLGPLPSSGSIATPTYANAPSSAATIVPGPFSAAPLLPGATAVPGQGDLAALQHQLQAQQSAQQAQIQALQNQMQKALSAMDQMRQQGAVVPLGFDLAAAAAQGAQGGGAAGAGAVAETPIDVNGLVAKKGYNPGVFDLRPQNARFFVIKSYTEEDVHKSLKYEIWASTDLGNKRLDRAFRESADKGPIYLFFSVNASGHFAGMAQMLTPVDYSMSSNVWASDKWKGVLKVRWIYIKDVPLSALRHIRLSNTPENKPVTSSRDTQEVPYDAGLEVLRIIASYQSRTSLLQDYAWYEASSRLQQAQQAAAQNGGDGSSAPIPQADFPLYQPGQHYHPQGHPNQQQQHQQLPPHSTPSPQPILAPPSAVGVPQPSGSPQPQAAQGPPRNPQAGGRRFWNRGGGSPQQTGRGGAGANPPVQPQGPPVSQPGLGPQGFYPPPPGPPPTHMIPPHMLQQQHPQQGQPYLGNGVAF